MTSPGPGSGADARVLRLHPSEHPENTIVDGPSGRIMREDWVIETVADAAAMGTAGSIYRAVAIAEQLFAATGEPLRVVHIVEREVARVGEVAP